MSLTKEQEQRLRLWQGELSALTYACEQARDDRDLDRHRVLSLLGTGSPLQALLKTAELPWQRELLAGLVDHLADVARQDRAVWMRRRLGAVCTYLGRTVSMAVQFHLGEAERRRYESRSLGAGEPRGRQGSPLALDQRTTVGT